MKIPLILPSFLATERSLLNPFVTSKNKKGDNKHPYLKALKTLKNLEGEPLIRTTKLADDTHPIIQFTIVRFKLV
jgi:hypothetical protein